MSVHRQVMAATEQQLVGLGHPLFSPLSGHVLALSEHPDPFFAGGTLGCGIAVEMHGHKLVAPFDGWLESVKAGGSEFVLKSDSGIRLLIAINLPLDEMPLTGTRLNYLNKTRITRGEQLAYFDLRRFKENRVAAIIVLNHKKLGAIYFSQQQVSAGSDTLLTITKKS